MELNRSEAHKANLMKQLNRFLPAKAVEYCCIKLMQFNLHLHLEVERRDRLGDFSPHLGKGNRISINHNLNPYDFLITFLHELAHFTAHQKYGNRHQPHGKEWKEEFKNQVRPLIGKQIFPPDIEYPLIRHMRKPSYTHTGDVELVKALRKYDRNSGSHILLDSLPDGSLFKMGVKGRIVMRKGKKRRTYYECMATQSGKMYLVHAVAQVTPLAQ